MLGFFHSSTVGEATSIFLRKFIQEIINSEGRIESISESHCRDDQNMDSEISTTVTTALILSSVQGEGLCAIP